jgi:hypothetical protein
MKQALTKALVAVLALICMLSCIHIVVDAGQQRRARILLVEKIIADADGVWMNLDEVFKNSPDTAIQSVSGARRYYSSFVELIWSFTNLNDAYGQNILFWRHEFLEWGRLDYAPYMTLSHVQDRYTLVWEKYDSGEAFSAADYAFLQRLSTAFKELSGALRNPDGSINKKTANSGYFTDAMYTFVEQADHSWRT